MTLGFLAGHRLWRVMIKPNPDHCLFRCASSNKQVGISIDPLRKDDDDQEPCVELYGPILPEGISLAYFILGKWIGLDWYDDDDS